MVQVSVGAKPAHPSAPQGGAVVLEPDGFVAQILARPTYRVIFRDRGGPGQPLDLAGLAAECAFIYARVAVGDVQRSGWLEDRGFRLVDINVTLEKALDAEAKAPRADFEIRPAHPEDQEAVAALAGRCFNYSRFHLDPLIDAAAANRIKAEWARNFFRGQRGDAMVVAVDGETVVGFLQLLRVAGSVLVIDLIGVDESHQRRSLARAMIAFAERQHTGFSTVRVGTQLANQPSLRLYQRSGFHVWDAACVFHWHGAEPIRPVT